MADYKETQAAWARGRCIEKDHDGQEGRWIIVSEHTWGEIKVALFVRIKFRFVKIVI